MARVFAKNFDEADVQVADLSTHMMEEFIAEATKLSTEGERWFKKKPLFTNIDQFLT